MTPRESRIALKRINSLLASPGARQAQAHRAHEELCDLMSAINNPNLCQAKKDALEERRRIVEDRLDWLADLPRKEHL